MLLSFCSFYKSDVCHSFVKNIFVAILKFCFNCLLQLLNDLSIARFFKYIYKLFFFASDLLASIYYRTNRSSGLAIFENCIRIDDRLWFVFRFCEHYLQDRCHCIIWRNYLQTLKCYRSRNQGRWSESIAQTIRVLASSTEI